MLRQIGGVEVDRAPGRVRSGRMLVAGILHMEDVAVAMVSLRIARRRNKRREDAVGVEAVLGPV